jgi:hypothetical protein
MPPRWIAALTLWSYLVFWWILSALLCFLGFALLVVGLPHFLHLSISKSIYVISFQIGLAFTAILFYHIAQRTTYLAVSRCRIPVKEGAWWRVQPTVPLPRIHRGIFWIAAAGTALLGTLAPVIGLSGGWRLLFSFGAVLLSMYLGVLFSIHSFVLERGSAA